jgi:hypothetical protein
MIKNNIYYYTRRGLKHAGDANTSIIQMRLNKGMDDKIEVSTIYHDSDASIDVRNIAGGDINSSHYLFFSKYNPSILNKWVGFGYVKYNNETNSSIYFDLGLNGYEMINAHGHMIQVEDIYYQPFYAKKGSTYYLSMLKSIDNGESWEFGPIIYQGSKYYNETSGEYLGDGLVRLISRINSNEGMKQFFSYDYGDTWNIDEKLNISSNGTNIPHSVEVDDSIYLIYTDRYDSTLKISFAKKTDAFSTPFILANETKFILANETKEDIYFLGYSPSIYDNGFFYTVYANHVNRYKDTETIFLKYNKKYFNNNE